MSKTRTRTKTMRTARRAEPLTAVAIKRYFAAIDRVGIEDARASKALRSISPIIVGFASNMPASDALSAMKAGCGTYDRSTPYWTRRPDEYWRRLLLADWVCSYAMPAWVERHLPRDGAAEAETLRDLRPILFVDRAIEALQAVHNIQCIVEHLPWSDLGASVRRGAATADSASKDASIFMADLVTDLVGGPSQHGFWLGRIASRMLRSYDRSPDDQLDAWLLKGARQLVTGLCSITPDSGRADVEALCEWPEPGKAKAA